MTGIATETNVRNASHLKQISPRRVVPAEIRIFGRQRRNDGLKNVEISGSPRSGPCNRFLTRHFIWPAAFWVNVTANDGFRPRIQVLDEVRDAIGNHAGLTVFRARKNQHRPFGCLRGFQLLRIE